MAPCRPWQSWRRSQLRGSTSLMKTWGKSFPFVRLPPLHVLPFYSLMKLLLFPSPVSSHPGCCGSTSGPDMIVTVTATVRLKAAKEWRSFPPHHRSRSVTAWRRLTPSTPRCHQQPCQCQPQTHSPAKVAALSRLVRLYFKKLPCTFAPLLTTERLSQLVFSSEPWTSHLQTQVKSLCHKEQQRGENSSFINVSKCQADPKAHLCQRPLSVRVLFTCYYPVAYQVNGATTHFSHSGYFVVSVDACSGKITQKKPFARMDAGMEQYLKTGIPDRWVRTKTHALSSALAISAGGGGCHRRCWILSQLPSAGGRREASSLQGFWTLRSMFFI